MHRVALLKRGVKTAGGLEKYTSRLIQAFAGRKVPLTVVSSSSPALFTYQKIKKFDTYCQTFLKKHPHEIVIGLDRTSSQTHLRAGNGVHAAYLEIRKKREGIFKAVSFACNPLHRLLLKIEKESFESPELRSLIVNSNLVRTQILTHYRVNPEKIHVLHNGTEWKEVEKDFLSWEQEKKNLSAKLNLSPHIYHFLFVGHDFKRKGLGLLLRALSLLPSKEFHLSIIGKDKHAATYKTLAHQLNLTKHVTFWGTDKKPASFYQLADCLVIPSLYDPFANVTLEALSLGVYVISSSTNGGSEVIASSEQGFILPSLEVEAIAHALEEALKRPKTPLSASLTRASVEHLDFSSQLTHFCNLCLS